MSHLQQIEWLPVEGGICHYGDHRKPIYVKPLLWMRTPVTFRHLGIECASPDTPATKVCHEEAIEISRTLNGRLPTAVEWEWAAGGSRRRFPWGNRDWKPNLANLRTSGVGGPLPVATFPDGDTPQGISDMAGNVWEWTKNKGPHNSVILKGGSYFSLPLHVAVKFKNLVPAGLRSNGIGVRLVKSLRHDTINELSE